MQYALLIVLGAAVGIMLRRIAFWRRCGYPRTARRLYLRLSVALGGACWAAMALQEALLYLSGRLTLANALPLHLCSVMGLAALPMLLTRRSLLRQAGFYLGMPGALLALLFPAVADTPWPQLTAAAFHLMHCCVFLAPLLPMSLGLYPTAQGAVWAGVFLVLHGFVALGVNALTGGNYLFLSGSPIPWMNRWGLAAWRGILLGGAAAVLALEGLCVFYLHRKRGRSS